jgi:hypothetical protein
MRKAITFIIILLIPAISIAQINNPGKDNAPFHFGITLGYSQTQFKVIHSEEFARHDSILLVESPRVPGISIGIVSNLRLSDNWDFRFVPSLSFADKRLEYNLIADSSATMAIEAVYLDFPFLVKFKSDRVRNFRMYLVGGVKYSMDMASNAEARNAEGIVKINPTDISAEMGFGMEFYAPLFKFAPELKFSYGLFDILTHDDKLQFSEVLGSLLTRGFVISFHFEG